jgi:hypothetical protein
MLERWLTIHNRENCEYTFAVLDASESGASDDELLDFLAQEILLAHANPDMIKHDCESLLQDARELNLDVIERYISEEILELDWAEIERKLLDGYLNKEIFPNLNKGNIALITRIGNWGEMLAAEYLVIFEGFWFPIYKLRLREKKDWAAKLTDLCLLKTDDLDKPLVCYSEVKTHSSQCDKNLGIEGHNSLVGDDALDDPEILRFIKVWLYEAGEIDKAQFFSDLKAGRIECDKRHDLYIIHDRNTWEEAILTNLDNNGIDEKLVDFSVRVFLINALRDIIDGTYERTWLAALEAINE